MTGFSDEERWDFDTSDMDWQEDRVQAARDGEFGDLYRNHLDVAVVLTRWAKAVGDQPEYGTTEHAQGFIQALEEVAARLRQADYVPGNGEVPE
ncbi:hypothetical protein [Streptomyces sp. CAI-85]|uniref:hypothetical protein n=1 Tax=Streptomyces sp. CAI-85 TaxID=1472662 RepID=UPI001587693F|nr:hypothetical protein [Streptomyces sp. CAI-85]NUV60672.1 hypothetical protein [Streptomyces sp. CAI-85]